MKNSYYVKIRKLKIFTRTVNVFMSDCSSLVASDGSGNNKGQGFKGNLYINSQVSLWDGLSVSLSLIIDQ